jgi:hypothetical protein
VGYIDAIQISIVEMNLFSARYVHPTLSQSPVGLSRAKLLDNCSIDVLLCRNLSGFHHIPNNQ